MFDAEINLIYNKILKFASLNQEDKNYELINCKLIFCWEKKLHEMSLYKAKIPDRIWIIIRTSMAYI